MQRPRLWAVVSFQGSKRSQDGLLIAGALTVGEGLTSCHILHRPEVGKLAGESKRTVAPED